jgi:hypothetical protein
MKTGGGLGMSDVLVRIRCHDWLAKNANPSALGWDGFVCPR